MMVTDGSGYKKLGNEKLVAKKLAINTMAEIPDDNYLGITGHMKWKGEIF